MNREDITSLSAIAILIVCYSLDMFHQWWGLSEPEQISLTILAVTAILWISELVPLFVTSFIIIFLQTTWLMPAMKVEGLEIDRQSFLSPFFSDIILLFLGGFVISAMLHKYNLDQRIAKWILGKAHGNASLLLLLVILISSFFSMWMSNTATAAMMFAVILPIINQMEKDSRFSIAIALSIPFACNLGGLGTPIGTPPNAIAISYLAKNNIHISFAEWMVLAVPVLLVMLFILWRLLLLLYPIAGEKLGIVCVEDVRLSRKHYSIITIFLITCLGWLTTDIHGFSSGTVSLFPVIACFGFRLLNTQDFRSLSWDVLFMLGGGLSLGVGLKESGLIGELVAMVPDNTETWVIVAAFGLLGMFMSSLISNTATANLLIPVTVSLGGEAAFATMVVAMACSGSMALPVSTPPNAIAFGSGILQTRQMLTAGGIISIITLLAVFSSYEFYWMFLGIF